MSFQTHIYFFLRWNTKGDVLKNVDAALLMKVYGDQGLWERASAPCVKNFDLLPS